MDDLFNKLIKAFMELIESGEEIPDAVFETITGLIQAKIAAMAQPSAKPEIPSGPFESSNVNGFKYSPKTGELLVQFHGPYPKAEGSIYSYKNVPKFIFDIFAKGAIGPKTSGSNAYHKWVRNVTPSLGGTLNAIIKAGNFPYQKIA